MTFMETMTAKEMLTNLFNVEFLNESEIDTIATAMDMYAKGKCKEQRKICCDIIEKYPLPRKSVVDVELERKILNAPEPEFETLKMKVNENY